MLELLARLVGQLERGAEAIQRFEAMIEKLGVAYQSLTVGIQTRRLTIVDEEGRIVAVLDARDGAGELVLQDPAVGRIVRLTPPPRDG